MDNGNPRRYDPNELVSELIEIDFHTEPQAKSYVYFDVMNGPDRDAEQIFGIPEDELADELENARNRFNDARTTIKAVKEVDSRSETLDLLIGAGLLNKKEAEAYIHSEPLDDAALVDMLDESLSTIEENRKQAEEKIDRAYQLREFRYDHRGFQIS